MSVKANLWLEDKSPEVRNLDGCNTWTLGYEGLTIFIRNEHEASELLKAVALIIAGMKEQEN